MKVGSVRYELGLPSVCRHAQQLFFRVCKRVPHSVDGFLNSDHLLLLLRVNDHGYVLDIGREAGCRMRHLGTHVGALNG